MSTTRTMTSYKPLPPSSSSSLDIKVTELRLGLPGTDSPERKHRSTFESVSAFGFDSGDEDPCLGISLNPTRNTGLGTKRGFLDTIDGCFVNGGGLRGALKSQGFASEATTITKDIVAAVFDRDERSTKWEKMKNERGSQHGSAVTATAAKAQIVGWPPIRSFRKNTTASSLDKTIEDVDGKSTVAGCLCVKVSMDGAPYLRKVDLKNYRTYAELLTALEQMFNCFTIASGSRASKELPGGGEISSQKRFSDLVSSSDYKLTYEDKDGDWMLVGDVPWRMFAESCRRMRIMKGSEATTLGTELPYHGRFYYLPSREFMACSVLSELPDCSSEVRGEVQKQRLNQVCMKGQD